MDAFSTIHVGNGALLENSIKICKKAFPNSKISILTLDKESNLNRYKNVYDDILSDFPKYGKKSDKIIWTLKFLPFILFQYINIFFLKKDPIIFAITKKQKNYISIIKDHELCISVSGEVINDTYYPRLYLRLMLTLLTIKMGKKFIIFPQSIGPIYKPLTFFLLKKILNQTSLIAGRDIQSFELLKKLQLPKEKILYSPDVAIIQDIASYDINKYFNNKNGKIIVGITVSQNPNEIMTNIDYITKIADSIEKSLSNEEYKLLIMPSNFIKNGKSIDYKLCEKIQNKLLKKNFEVSILDNRLYFPDEFKALLTQLDFFISTRMHVMILAFSGAVPTIAINTQHKIKGFMKSINMEKYCLEFNELENLSQIIKDVKNNKINITSIIEKSILELKKELNNFIKNLKQL